MTKIPISYYQQDDVVTLAKDLLGKVLCTNIDGTITKGIISETEAYNGAFDKACHAYNNRRTARTETMFHDGGIAYVYLCYGIHHLFNIVTGEQDVPTAILVRGIIPLEGEDVILKRRNKSTLKNIAGGPGTASQALGIKTSLNGVSLSESEIWLENHQIEVPEKEVLITPRIGIDYAEEDKDLPYRFVWKR